VAIAFASLLAGNCSERVMPTWGLFEIRVARQSEDRGYGNGLRWSGEWERIL